MLHSQIENEDIVERYVGNQLASEDRQAFEEHFFGCQECFDKLQAAERFAAGIRDAVNRGLVDETSSTGIPTAPARTVSWALIAVACAAVIVASVTGWMSFALRRQLDRTSAQLVAERQSHPQLGQVPVEQQEANVPLVILQASRSAEEPPSITLPPEARQLVLWIEIGSSRYNKFQLQVFSPQDRLIASLDQLQPGPYGALSASLPAGRLTAGDFRIRLSGLDPPPASLAGEYHFRIRKP